MLSLFKDERLEIAAFETNPSTIQPPPLHAINGVACSGSFFTEKPIKS